MRTMFEQTFPAMSMTLMQVAEGIAIVSGHNYVVSDMVHTLSALHDYVHSVDHEGAPYYIAIREQGVESGDKKHCLERCKGLGYPIVIFKIEEELIDYKMTIRLSTHTDGDWTDMEMEFDAI